MEGLAVVGRRESGHCCFSLSDPGPGKAGAPSPLWEWPGGTGAVPHPSLFLLLRGPRCTQIIPVQGRVTSLSLSHDQLHLLSCSRDDTLKIIDLRVFNIRQVFRYQPGATGSAFSCVRPCGALLDWPLDQDLLKYLTA
jgi:WD40 repeat protein